MFLQGSIQHATAWFRTGRYRTLGLTGKQKEMRCPQMDASSRDPVCTSLIDLTNKKHECDADLLSMQTYLASPTHYPHVGDHSSDNLDSTSRFNRRSTLQKKTDTYVGEQDTQPSPLAPGKQTKAASSQCVNQNAAQSACTRQAPTKAAHQ